MTRTLDDHVDPCSGRASDPPDPDRPHPVTRGPSHVMPSSSGHVVREPGPYSDMLKRPARRPYSST